MTESSHTEVAGLTPETATRAMGLTHSTPMNKL